ncbi:UNVERIFIED_CONTAM: hypothetical protein FKN15_059378 [Acipenser sinensis]
MWVCFEITLPPPAPFLSVPAKPPVPWSCWIDSFQMYLLALDRQDVAAPRKRAIMLHCLGMEGQHVFSTLQPMDDSFEAATAALSDHFSSRQSVFMHRFQFWQRAQRPGESVRQFVSLLRELVKHCKFDAIQDELIRDQLTEKTSTQLRERLLLESDNLTLEKALAIGKQAEATLAEACTLISTWSVSFSNVTAQIPVKNVYNTPPARCCANCGSTRHETRAPTAQHRLAL